MTHAPPLADLNQLSGAEKEALIVALWTRLAALEAKLNEPAKTPDNSSLPPSHVQVLRLAGEEDDHWDLARGMEVLRSAGKREYRPQTVSPTADRVLNTPRCEFCQTQETVSDFLPMLGFKVDVRSLAKTEAEVEQDRPSGIIVCKNDVVGLHIPVHQSGFVTLTQDSEQFPCRVDRFVELNPLPSLTPLAQRWALDEIGHDIGLDLNLLPPMLIGVQY